MRCVRWWLRRWRPDLVPHGAALGASGPSPGRTTRRQLVVARSGAGSLHGPRWRRRVPAAALVPAALATAGHGEEPDDGSYRSSGQVLLTRAAAAAVRRRDPTNPAPAQPPGAGGAGAGGAPQDWGRGARNRDTVRLRAPWSPLGKRSPIEPSASSYPKRTEIYRDLGCRTSEQAIGSVQQVPAPLPSPRGDLSVPNRPGKAERGSTLLSSEKLAGLVERNGDGHPLWRVQCM